MADNLKDLPSTPSGLDPTLKTFLDRMREAVQVLRANRGDPLDAAITWRTAISKGIATLLPSGNVGDGGSIIVGSGGTSGGSDSGSSSTPDLTPPPTVTGLSVSAGLSNVIVQFDAPVYTQGHGNERTDIYAVQRDPTSTAAAPVFGDASIVGSAAGASPIISIPSSTGTKWFVWAKYVSADGVHSTAPAGGTNGVTATTGKIGNADLGPLIVEAGNLATTDLSNLITYGKGDSDNGWVGLFMPNSIGSATFWLPSSASTVALEFATRDSFFGTKFAVTPGEQFFCAMDTSPFGGGTSIYAFTLSLAFYDAAGATLTPPAGAGAVRAVGVAGIVSVSGDVTAPAGAAFARVWVQIAGPAGTTWYGINGEAYYATNLSVRRKNPSNLLVDGVITAPKLAANAIAVGTLAVQNGALVNAMIGNLQVDDAKISAVSVAKLTAGSVAVGEYIQSSGYVAGSAGWKISGSGVAEFSGVIVRGTIIASGGSIGGATISTTGVQSVSYAAGSAGWRLDNASGIVYAASVRIQDATGTRILNTDATGTQVALQLGSALQILGNGTAVFGGSLTAAGVVDTLNSVSAAYTFLDLSTHVGSGADQTVLSITFTLNVAAPVILFFQCEQTYPSGNVAFTLDMKLNGTSIAKTRGAAAFTDAPILMGFGTGVAGTNAVIVTWNGANSNIQLGTLSGYPQRLVVLGLMR